MRIENESDLRITYEIILMREHDKDSKSDYIKEHIKELKKEIRRYHNESSDLKQTYLWGDSCDGGWVKVIFPENVKSRTAALDFYNAFLKRESRPSQYDCTGQHSTFNEHFFKRSDGRLGIYYYETIDM